jgi:ribosomal protein L37AE/L43A
MSYFSSRYQTDLFVDRWKHKCDNCKTKVGKNDYFCYKCGGEIKRKRGKRGKNEHNSNPYCPECKEGRGGREIDGRWTVDPTYCHKCGTELEKRW